MLQPCSLYGVPVLQPYPTRVGYRCYSPSLPEWGTGATAPAYLCGVPVLPLHLHALCLPRQVAWIEVADAFAPLTQPRGGESLGLVHGAVLLPASDDNGAIPGTQEK